MDRVLPSPPRLAALYAAGLARSAVRSLHGNRRSLDLPADRHRLDELTAAPQKVAEFQALMGAPPSDFLPSGYIHTLAFPVAVSVLARRDFPLPLLGMIHLRNEIEHLRPVALNERLRVTAWAEDLRPHRSGTQVDVVVDVDSASERVWTGRSTYLAKGVRSATTAPDPAPAAADQKSEQLPGYPTAVWDLRGDIGRRYAAVSGDFNPIHLSVPTARALGLKRPIAHGMYLASRVVAAAGPTDASGFRWTIDFRAPVSLPSTVYLSAKVDRSPTARWRGAEVVAWDPRRRRTHFFTRLEGLAADEHGGARLSTA